MLDLVGHAPGDAEDGGEPLEWRGHLHQLGVDLATVVERVAVDGPRERHERGVGGGDPIQQLVDPVGVGRRRAIPRNRRIRRTSSTPWRRARVSNSSAALKPSRLTSTTIRFESASARWQIA